MNSAAVRTESREAHAGDQSPFETTEIRVGDRVELWTLPGAGELPVIGTAGARNVWVPNVDKIPFVANVRHIVRRTPRSAKHGWYVRAGSAELQQFEYDLGHPLMSSDPPRDARFFASEAAAVRYLVQRLDEEYRRSAAEAARAREGLLALRERYPVLRSLAVDQGAPPALQ